MKVNKLFVTLVICAVAMVISSCSKSEVTADYSQDILGMWEGVDMTGSLLAGRTRAAM